MSKWIDAEWLKELYKPYESYNGKELAVPIGAILANIEDAPSIDIVRCKECEHGTYCEKAEMYICSVNDQDLYEAEHFCSYGERRE